MHAISSACCRECDFKKWSPLNSSYPEQRIQNTPDGGGVPTICPLFPEKGMKMNKIRQMGDAPLNKEMLELDAIRQIL